MHGVAEINPKKGSSQRCLAWLAILLILAGLVIVILMVLKNNLSKGSYVAAVVEYAPFIFDTPQKTIEANSQEYETIIKNAKVHNVDIIVFPEAGLTGTTIPSERDLIRNYLTEIPPPEANYRPCEDPENKSVLKKLSCAAKSNKMYVAVNLLEIARCNDKRTSDCPEDEDHFYNTNIVFDRDGMIIARYRKFNLFIEKGFNSPNVSELCTFKTDFGVTFGMFICFDILFNDPSVRLIKEKHVTDIVYSTAWFSELPLLTAVATQAAWAYSMNVNLLAAGYDCPEMMGGGSGIYAGTKGPLVVIMPQQAGTKVLIANVPKKRDHSVLQYILEMEEELFDSNKPAPVILPNETNKSPFNDMKFLQDLSLRSFMSQALVSDDSITVTNKLHYENNRFQCDIDVTWSRTSANYAKYKMIAYSGNRNFSTASVNHIEVCGLILCSESTLNSCGILPDFTEKPDLLIQSVKIKVKSYNVSSIPVPSTLNSTLYPLDVTDFTFTSSIENDNGEEYYSIEMELLKPVSNLITFAVYKLPSDPSSDHRRR